MNIIRFFYLRVIFSFKKHKKRHESNMTHVPVLIKYEPKFLNYKELR